MIDERAQMYLKAVAELSEGGEKATTSSIARRLDVSQPSVTEMLQRLSAKGLVSHKARGPVRLTKEGERLATSLIRRHRLWENFLIRFLGFSWEEVHDEACELEHATSPILEERLAELMSDLEACPHGHAIPGREGRTSEEGATARIPFSYDDGFTGSLTVDTKTRLPKRIETAVHFALRALESKVGKLSPKRYVTFDGWKETAGRFVPTRLTYHDGVTTFRLELGRLDCSSPIDPAMFSPPKKP